MLQMRHNVLDATKNVHKVPCCLKVLRSLWIVSFSITHTAQFRARVIEKEQIWSEYRTLRQHLALKDFLNILGDIQHIVHRRPTLNQVAYTKRRERRYDDLVLLNIIVLIQEVSV